ncbi:MAG TPA: calcium-binding protein [Thermoleophilaceae bacterium]|nr:calcium-binding protein [Thermoleophilaceae bacterium]
MLRRCFLLLALAGLVLAPPAAAGHVSSNPQVSARLGERLSSNSWIVIVDWSINCSGASSPNYTGNLNLIDVDTGERIYMGGTSSAGGSDRQPIERRSLPRRLMPELSASCFDSPPSPHGSGTKTVTGNTVTVPGKGDEDGDGRVDRAPGGGGGGPGGSRGAQGPRDFGSRFGGPRDPLRPGGCDTLVLGTRRSETLNGTAGPDLIFGLGGRDLIRGRAGHDCLIGDSGADRLFGQAGADRLTGGRGDDLLVGGQGVNRYDAGAGRDRVRAANGRAELVSCGSGRDRARVDRSDRVRSCERVARAG